jgi:phosphate transport system substrate-binding protein
MVSDFWIGSQLSAGTLIALVLGLTACSGGNQASLPAPEQAATAQELVDAAAPTTEGVQIDGSSSVYPITDAIAKKYRQEQGEKTQIEVKFSGTSGGFRKFCAAKTDVSNASRPILIKEIEACNKAGVRFIELPIAFDALTIVVNPQNTWAKDITVEELKQLWEPAAQGKIMKWNQIRSAYPNQPVKLFGAGKDSGTFDYFNEVTTGKPDGSRSDYTSSEDDNALVEGIAKDPNAIGYIPFSYYEKNLSKLKALAIDSGKGAVLPSAESVKKAQYQPFSRPLFIYINAKSAQEKPEVRAFVEFYLKNAKPVASAVGYIPLPEEGYHLATVQFSQGEVGTVFEGAPQPNVTIAELLRRQKVFQLSSQK